MSTLIEKRMSLAEASFTAFKWDYVGTATRTVSSFVVTIVLARLLGPEPFGLLAASWLVLGLANLVADLGMGPALLQRPTISDKDVRHAFTMQVCMGIVLMAGTVLAAPLFAYVFSEPKVAPVVRVMSLTFLLQTFSGVAVALMKRRMAFRQLQLARITSYLVGYVGLGIPLAFLGFEVWSLVFAQLLQTALFSLLCYAQAPHSVKPVLPSASNRLNQFGLKVLLTNIVNYAISNLDTLFIGRFFDLVTLGLYNRIFVLVTTPMNSVVSTFQQVTFAAYSRIQENPDAIRRAYLAGVGFMATVMLPVFGCTALVPETVIQGLFGSQWVAAVPFLVPLALAMPFHAVMGTGGPMLWARNRVGREFAAQLTTATVLVVVLFVTARISAIAVAWGILAVTLVRFLLITHTSLKSLNASWSSLSRPAFGSLLVLSVTGVTVLFGDHALLSLQVAPLQRLMFDSVAGLTVFLTVIVLMPRLIFSSEMYWLTERLGDLLPTPINLFVKRISTSNPFAA